MPPSIHENNSQREPPAPTERQPAPVRSACSLPQMQCGCNSQSPHSYEGSREPRPQAPPHPLATVDSRPGQTSVSPTYSIPLWAGRTGLRLSPEILLLLLGGSAGQREARAKHRSLPAVGRFRREGATQAPAQSLPMSRTPTCPGCALASRTSHPHMRVRVLGRVPAPHQLCPQHAA